VTKGANVTQVYKQKMLWSKWGSGRTCVKKGQKQKKKKKKNQTKPPSSRSMMVEIPGIVENRTPS
jgi:hypothetical protein